MNIENLKKLRDAVAQTTEFNMESYCVPGEFPHFPAVLRIQDLV